MTEDLTQDKLTPAHPMLKAAMTEGLEGRVRAEEIDNFVAATQATSVPDPLSATASVIFAAIYGNVTCTPKGQPWKFDQSIWGIGAQGGTSIGFLYTAYENWDAFFRMTTSFHVQGIADGGGVLQINWFNKHGTPIGQFNGALAGAGGLEGGGAGHWKHT